ncbi:guanine nucleotide-binding protein subunit alpha [Podochytrium sp. JEL0797]|nr:guanine nucleotide-binding protein subunit alpha [Podochytrium sp. JEL0797]
MRSRRFSVSCSQKSPEEAESDARSFEIETMLQQEAKQNSKPIKLLILGAGESGKSTVLKQMKLMNGINYSQQEITLFRLAITKNIITCAQTLVHAMDTLEIPYGFDPLTVKETDGSQLSPEDLKNTTFASPVSNAMAAVSPPNSLYSHYSKPSLLVSKHSMVEGAVWRREDPVAKAAVEAYRWASLKSAPVQIESILQMNASLSQEDIETIRWLWNDSGVQYCYSRNNEYQLMDSYIPTDDDILQARIMTTTVAETNIEVNPQFKLRVFDVGGQRSQRNKWAQYFENVDSIMFIVAVSDYDRVCLEDSTTNRMVESLNLFSTICNHPMFKSTPLIVFLNKVDLFEQKLKHTPLKEYFPSFTDADDVKCGCQYFKQRMLEINKYPERKMYFYNTFATDKKQMKTILTAVNMALLEDSMVAAGFS